MSTGISKATNERRGNYFKKVITILKADLIEYTRVKIAIVVSMLQPVVMMIAFGLVSLHGGQENFIHSAPGILGVAVMFSVTFSAGFTTISDRERRLIDDVVLSPVSYSAFILSRLFSAMIKCILPTAAALLIGMIFFDLEIVHVSSIIFSYIISVVIYAGLGMMVGAFTNHLAFEGMVNFFLIPAMFFGGVFFPVDQLGPLSNVVRYFAITPSIELFRYGLSGQIEIGSLLSSYIILLIYAVVSFLMGVFSFKAAVTKR
ncbi:ABC transporter permease [Paenibacillus sp. NPDC057934]|uniref:ABC transporter permease n=1 Tax=Paenibacillus sp. NPDC057934 TaxID=3346282 RepID=UPI0036DCC9BD